MSTRVVPYRFLKALQEAAGRRHDATLNRVIEALYLQPDEEDAEHTQMLAEQFDFEARIRGRLLHPFAPSPPPEVLAQGQMPISTLCYYPNEVVLVPLAGHKYIAGSVQTGKTWLARLMLLFAYRAGRRVLVFDPLGRFAEGILNAVPPDDLHIVQAQHFCINPLEPPASFAIREWLGLLANIEREVWYYRKNTENFSMNTALAVLEAGQPLNLKSFLAAVAQRKPKQYGTEFESWDRVKSTTESLVNAIPSLAVVSSAGMREILRRRVVIFDWSRLLNNTHKKYLTLLVLAWLLASRAHEEHEWDLLVVCDEVHELASVELARTLDVGEPFFEVAVRTAGNRGVSFVTIDQNPAFTHPVVRANAAVKILFRLDGGEDKRTMAADFSLSREQAAFLSALQPRQAVFKLPVFDPFLVNIPEIVHANRTTAEGDAR